MRAYAVSDKGPVRRENQDRGETCAIRAPRGLILAVCDGMGGANSGALASSVAIENYLSFLKTHLSSSKKSRVLLSYWMKEACRSANAAVYQRAISDKSNAGMGTTLVSAVILGKTAQIINVGDSRAYLVRGKTMEQITRDHSVVAELVAAGEITAEQARVHPNRNLITRAIGVETQAEPDLYLVSLRRGDRLLLCSDGLTNTLDIETIRSLCADGRSAEAICRALVERAVSIGARDNVTAAVAIV